MAHDHRSANLKSFGRAIGVLLGGMLATVSPAAGQGGGPPRHADHDPELLAALSQELQAPIIDRVEVVRCEGRRRCKLVGSTVVFGVGVPQIGEDRAKVPVQVTYQLDVGSGWVESTGAVVILERQAGVWRAVGVEMEWTT